MIFKGHQKSSFIDYPDKISTVLFTGGCNFKCPYCHNGHLVKNTGEFIDEDYIFSYLRKRSRMIDAVCISGGEPTLHEGIYDFIKKVKDLGYLVKLDTNGTNPDMLERLIDDRLLDYVAMDIKAPFDKYIDVVNSSIDIQLIDKSINILMASYINYEFRTTVCKELLELDDILDIAESLKGAKRYILQNFRDGDTILAGKGKFTPFKKEEFEVIASKIDGMFEEFKIRF